MEENGGLEFGDRLKGWMGVVALISPCERLRKVISPYQVRQDRGPSLQRNRMYGRRRARGGLRLDDSDFEKGCEN